MQDELFSFKIRFLKIGSYDMVLGMDWIDVVAPVILHTKPHRLSLMKDGRMVTLIGVNEKTEVTPVDTATLSKMLNNRTCIMMAELSMATASPAAKGKKEMDPSIEKLLAVSTLMCFRSQLSYHQRGNVIMSSTNPWCSTLQFEALQVLS